MDIKQKVIVITGASSGIGRAAAMQFARDGHTVVLASRNEEKLNEAAEKCRHAGGTIMVVRTDVTKQEEVDSLDSRVFDQFGRIDVWVNNAAVSVFGQFEEIPMEAIKKVVDTNLMGYIYGSRAAIKRFRQQGHGNLINVSSTVGVTGQPFSSYYALTQFAIRGLSLSLQEELANEPNIHVCCVLPATMDTPFFQHAANYSGKTVKAMPPVFDPQKSADMIVKLSKRPKSEVFVGYNALPAEAMHFTAPRLFNRMLRKRVEKSHFSDESAPVSPGNLFEVMSDEDITGGWRSNGQGMNKKQKRLLKAAITAAGLTGGYMVVKNLRKNINDKEHQKQTGL